MLRILYDILIFHITKIHIVDNCEAIDYPLTASNAKLCNRV